MTWERALEADARLAAKNSVLIRAALRQSIDFEAAYRGYQATTPDESLTLPQQRTRARAWAIINIRVNLEAFKEVLYRTWAQAYALGDLASREQLVIARRLQKSVRTEIDWSKWKPGDAASAIILKPPKAFQRLLERQGIVFKGFSDTTLTDLGNAIGEAIELGLDAKTASKRIANHVASPARSLMIAITEQNRAISEATKSRYLEAGLEKMTWLVFDPCDKCAQNAGKTVNINQPFPSGDTQPPAHPNCRCALAPVIPGYNDDSYTGGSITNPVTTPDGTLVGQEPETNYRGHHQAPTRADGFGAPGYKIDEEMMPDFYERPNIYTTGMPQADKESVRALLSIRNEPEKLITVYRAVPKQVTDINPGDWITLSRSYAETHLLSNVEEGHVISIQVKAKDLWFDGNSINEFGYDPTP